MGIIEQVMILTNCKDGGLLNVYQKMAFDDIRVYLNRENFSDDFIANHFESAVVRLMVKKIKGNSMEGRIQSYTQGSKSVTYATATEVDDDIKKMLPRPYIKLK